MPNTPKKNRTDETAAEQKLVDGLNKHAQTITQLVIAGADMTTKDIIAHLQSRIDGANATQTTRAAWLSAVKLDKADRVKLATYVSGVKQAILVAFAGQVDALADFGLVARKPRVLTPEKKIAAAAKAKATRAARHTLGKKQKAAITGTSAATAPTPPGAPAPAPAPAPKPAPAPVPAQPTAGAAPAAPVEPAKPLP
jgi:hypothetical protein